jgi:hypothetical protein
VQQDERVDSDDPFATLDALAAFTRARVREQLQRVRSADENRALRDELAYLAIVVRDGRTHPHALGAAVDVLRKRATRYADHPDFDELWRLEP